MCFSWEQNHVLNIFNKTAILKQTLQISEFRLSQEIQKPLRHSLFTGSDPEGTLDSSRSHIKDGGLGNRLCGVKTDRPLCCNFCWRGWGRLGTWALLPPMRLEREKQKVSDLDSERQVLTQPWCLKWAWFKKKKRTCGLHRRHGNPEYTKHLLYASVIPALLNTISTDKHPAFGGRLTPACDVRAETMQEEEPSHRDYTANQQEV